MHTSWDEYKTGMGWSTLLSGCPTGRDKAYTLEIKNGISHNDLHPYEAGLWNDQFGITDQVNFHRKGGTWAFLDPWVEFVGSV